MTAVVIAIRNPLKMSDRLEYHVPAGTTVEAALPSGWPRAVARVNGEMVEQDTLLKDDDCVVLVFQPEGLEAIIINILISIAISAAFALLFPPPKPKQERDDESSPTYGFAGITNNRAEGQPIPVVYGKMKVGGTIVNEFVDVEGLPPRSTLRQLVCYGEGPVHSIGGVTTDTPAAAPLTGGALPREVEINGNPAQNFTGVKAWARMGSNEQETIPGFNETRQTFAVGSELLSFASDIPASQTGETVGTNWTTGLNEFTTHNDATWTNRAVSYDFSAEAVDGFVVTLQFPGGFYGTNSTTGSAVSALLRYQVRYIELDGAGAPIASGGYASDGYVRLPVVGPLALRQRSAFQAQFRARFQDPQTYTPSTPGTALDTTATAGSSASYAATATQGYAGGFHIPHIGAFAWINISQTGPQAILSNKTGNQGFELVLDDRTYFNTGGISVTVLMVKIGLGSTTRTFYPGGFSAPSSLADGLFDSGSLNQWVHVGFRFIRTDFVELCVNGRVIQTFNATPSSNELEWPTSQPLVVGDNTTMLMDEVKVYAQAIGQPQFAADYAGGEGFAGAALGQESSMIFRAAYEDAAGVSEFGAGSTQWYATTPTLGGGAQSGVEIGRVRSGVVGTLKRSKYRVEIVRVSKTSTKSSVSNDVTVQDMQSVTSLSLSYPNSSMLGVEIDASEQLNDGAPTTTAVVYGRLCPVWDGASTIIPALPLKWSANPAWVSLELITNARYGLGRFYDARDVDLPKWLEWATYCDEIVYDGRPRITVDNPGASGVDADLYFSNAKVDPDTLLVRGEIWFEIGIVEKPTLPETWEAGRFIRLSGWPTSATVGIANDVDSPDGTGYEIFAVELILNVWTVKCYWDRLTETDPWTTGNRIGADILTVAALDGGIVEGASRRFEFNGVFDKPGRAWDSLLDIMAVGRAAPIPEGSKLSMRYSHPRSVVGVITPSNIVEGSFTAEYNSERTRPNSLTLSILDAEQGFETVPVQVQTSDLDSVSNQSFIRQENKTLFGVTDFGQAERHGNYVLNTNKLQRRSGTFSAALDALPYQVGDLLRVSSDVLPRGHGGRVAANSGPTKTGAVLDREAFDGAAWTASSVTVTPDSDTDPYGDATADTVNGTGYVSQALAFNSNDDGWVSIGMFFKDVSAGAPTIELTTDRGTSSVTYNLSLVTARALQSFDLPARGTIQASSGTWRYATASFFVKASDGNALTSALTLKLYPHDGATTGSCKFAKIRATQAPHAAVGGAVRGFVTDREIVLTPSVTNTFILQEFRGNTGTSTVDLTMTPAGTYPPGSTIFLTDSAAGIPTRGAPFIVATAADALTIELSGISRSSDLSADFEWVEYNADVFADDAVEDTSPPDTGDGAPRDKAGIQIYPGSGQLSSSALTEPSPGFFLTRVFTAWIPSPDGRDRILGSRVFWRELPDDVRTIGGWTLAAVVDGAQADAAFDLPGVEVGALIEVSVVVISPHWTAIPPEAGLRSTTRIDGLAWAPVAPTSIGADLRGGQAVYEAAYADEATGATTTRALALELRRGGWVLGAPIAARSAAGSRMIGPTDDIWQQAFNATCGRVHARSMTTAGMYSAEVRSESIDLSPSASIDVPDITMGGEQQWELATGTAWEAGSPSVGDPQTSANLIVNAANELEFTAGLTGTYIVTTDALSAISLDQSRQPRDIFLMAAVEAEQVHPVTFASMGIGFGSLELQRWSFEGPTVVMAQDPANCSLAIQVRVSVKGTNVTWGAWRPFTPGVYTAVDIQLRIQVTRPSTDYNVRIKQFHHKAVLLAEKRTEQTTRDLHARTEVI